ncbi:MAG: hypothetical protein CR979_02660, partial [Propionibacterium sp.]
MDAMLLPELKQLASAMGIKGVSGMRKNELLVAIKNHSATQPEIVKEEKKVRRRAERQAGEPEVTDDFGGVTSEISESDQGETKKPGKAKKAKASKKSVHAENPAADEIGARLAVLDETRGRNTEKSDKSDKGEKSDKSDQVERANNSGRDDEHGRRGRRRRQRDRQNRRNRGNQSGDRMDAEPVISEDDVLANVSGIVDLMENYAFVRTSGYLPGPNDAYLSLSTV